MRFADKGIVKILLCILHSFFQRTALGIVFIIYNVLQKLSKIAIALNQPAVFVIVEYFIQMFCFARCVAAFPKKFLSVFVFICGGTLPDSVLARGCFVDPAFAVLCVIRIAENGLFAIG